MPSAPEGRDIACGLCSQLRDREYALEHVQADREDTRLPEAAGRLTVVCDSLETAGGHGLEQPTRRKTSNNANQGR
jgi:hypothetical protein